MPALNLFQHFIFQEVSFGLIELEIIHHFNSVRKKYLNINWFLRDSLKLMGREKRGK